jgi:3-dehydroquinate synthetase
MMAADMSLRMGWIDAELVQRIRALNEKAKLPVTPPPVRMFCQQSAWHCSFERPP